MKDSEGKKELLKISILRYYKSKVISEINFNMVKWYWTVEEFEKARDEQRLQIHLEHESLLNRIGYALVKKYREILKEIFFIFKIKSNSDSYSVDKILDYLKRLYTSFKINLCELLITMDYLYDGKKSEIEIMKLLEIDDLEAFKKKLEPLYWKYKYDNMTYFQKKLYLTLVDASNQLIYKGKNWQCHDIYRNKENSFDQNAFLAKQFMGI